MAVTQQEVTLFAEPSLEALRLQREIAETGVVVHLVFWPGVPFVESRLATIRGLENIRSFFAHTSAP